MRTLVTLTDTTPHCSRKTYPIADISKAEDVLGFSNEGSTMGNIAGNYDSGGGVLTLTTSDASATLSEWQAALRTATYHNTSATPYMDNRTVTFTVNDGQHHSSPVTKMNEIAR